MPELPEVEAYRRLAEASALGRTIVSVVADDAWYIKGRGGADALLAALIGARFVAARRRGKLLLLDIGQAPTRPAIGATGPTVLGLRFGMTGRLLVDGVAGVDGLWYAPPRDDPVWDRFVVGFGDGGDLRIRDPRRLGGVELDPDVARLGPDALDITLGGLRRALDGSGTALKARLLDQARLAGVGNLAADEALWRAGLSPIRRAGSLGEAELRRLHRHLRATLGDFLAAGGSHTGRLMAQRGPGGRCPTDGAALQRSTVGGRTTWWCPAHQR